MGSTPHGTRRPPNTLRAAAILATTAKIRNVALNLILRILVYQRIHSFHQSPFENVSEFCVGALIQLVDGLIDLSKGDHLHFLLFFESLLSNKVAARLSAKPMTDEMKFPIKTVRGSTESPNCQARRCA